MGYQIEWDAAHASRCAKMHKRGIRVLPGGDYGFAFTPHCQNARDLEFFVKYLGFTPMEAIRSTTLYGGQIMMKPDELGVIKDGYLADLLLVDGDPLANLSILRDPKRILAVMKDGVFAKAPEIASQRRLGARRMTAAKTAGALLAAVRRAGRGVLGLGDRRQPAALLQDAAQRPDARLALLPGRERLHAGVRADAQRQPRARLALPARRLRRLVRRRAHRLVGAGGDRGLSRRPRCSAC